VTDMSSLPTIDLAPADLCVRCGLCLPACPTYLENGLEADSPRGRIALVKGIAHGRIRPRDAAVHHLDLCLDCRACETACPSGVVYHRLIESARARLQAETGHRRSGRLLRWVCLHLLPYPRRVRWALLPVRLARALGIWRPLARFLRRRLHLPMAGMLRLLPERGPDGGKLAEVYEATGESRADCSLFTGCVGSVFMSATHRRTIELLRHLGCRVTVPRRQSCCGAIHHHQGEAGAARQFARANGRTFAGTGPVLANIAGCGAMLKEYGELLEGEDDSSEAAGLARRVRDIHQFLSELGPPSPPHPVPIRAVYHDACHLAHAQGIRDEPRALLKQVRELELVEMPESEVCCGAAGIYNLLEPEMAGSLARRKVDHIEQSGCGTCVTGNIGCALQIEAEARRRGLELEVVHPVDLLHRAYFGPGASVG